MAADQPFVTVILPVRNEAAYLRAGLSAVLGQDYPAGRMEILVTDGMSTDGTREIVQESQQQHPSIKLIDNPGRIVPTGMNAALRQARGEIIIRVDGHCEIARDYVRKCVEHLQNDPIDGVGGPVETIGATPLAETIAVAMSSKFGVGGSAFRTETGKTMLADSIPFPAYTRSIIQKAGLYDEELVRNQDDEYNYRLRELGAKLLLAQDVHSRYFSRASLGKLWRQYYQYGFWKVRVLQKHPRQMSLRQFVPPLFAISLLLTTILALISPLFAIPNSYLLFPLILVIGSYSLANLLASVITSSKKGLRCLPLLPLVFAILHLAYGLGFLVGLIKFWNRWDDKVGKVPAWKADDAPAS